MSKYNNFFLHFPGGLYRSVGSHSKVCGELDKVLTDINFDMKSFKEISDRITSQVNRTWKLLAKTRDEIRNLTPEEEKEMKQLSKENKRDIELFDDLLKPIYNAMRNRGYSHKDLWT